MILNRVFENMCRNQILAESVSPDGSKKFVVFQRSCGATTGFSTQASLLSVDATLPDEKPGNVFAADTDHGVAPSGAGGGPELRSHWAAPNHLVIQHHVAARVFKAEKRLKDTEIKYETFK
ncbi:MAG TPA: hypothetical protein VGB09_05050 [Candidatus Binatia bacterium]